jgi:hypothetical protein
MSGRNEHMDETPQGFITDPEPSASGGNSARAPFPPSKHTHKTDTSLGSNRRTRNRHTRNGGIGWDIGLGGSILVVALLLRLWQLSTITDTYDEGVYWASLRALHAGNSLFTPVFSSQPPFFLLSMVPLVSLLGPTLLAGRLSIVFFSLLGVLAMYVLGRRLGGHWAAVGAALLLSTDHLYLIQSKTIQADAPSTALMIVAVAAASFADRAPWQASLLSGIATMLALLTKLFAVIAIGPILLLFLGQMSSMKQRKQASILHWAFLVAGCYLLGLVAAGLLIILPYFGQLQALYQQAIAFHLADARTVSTSFIQNFVFIAKTPVEYPLFFIALLGGGIGLFRRKWNTLIAAAWTLASLVILLQQKPLFDHHVVLLIPGLVLTASLGLAPTGNAAGETQAAGAPAPLLSRLQRFFPQVGAKSISLPRLGVPLVLFCGTVCFALGFSLLHPPGIPADKAAAFNAVTNDLKTLTTPDQQVITDDQYLADVADRSIPPELVDTSFERIQAGYLTTAQVIALAEQPQVGAIVFYTGRFDQLPGFRAWVEGHFHLAREYGNGRALYLSGVP